MEREGLQFENTMTACRGRNDLLTVCLGYDKLLMQIRFHLSFHIVGFSVNISERRHTK